MKFIPDDYIICRADVLDSVYIHDLLQRGFRFLDRILTIEINLRSGGERNTEISVNDITLSSDTNYESDVYRLACQAYTTDRRFHLDPVFNQEKADRNIQAYIDICRSRNMKIYKAKHGNELLGFTIVDEEADEKRVYFENVLGATLPGMKGKLVAGPLYRSMLEGEKDSFKKYMGKVSSSNAASINLHFQLGGYVKQIQDEYIISKA